ncbi:MAG: methyltransferase domain-containing protein [Thermomicrobiales bacterium]|nr:methyltransferase domain-containing protein [Thermomicrobiales bacterium]
MPMPTARLAQLRDEAAAIGLLRTDQVSIPGTLASYEITRPADFDGLLDAAAADPQQNLPYWAELWPGGVALAAELLQASGSLAGTRALELGCGLGVTATAAMQRGISLIVTDYSPESLSLCLLNAAHNAGRSPVARQMNWREPDAAFLQDAGEGIPLVLAADVLYEARDVEPLRQLTERIVAPGGALWLAEPGRAPARRFVDAMTTAGWSDAVSRCAGPWPDPEDNAKGVIVQVHRLTRG